MAIERGVYGDSLLGTFQTKEMEERKAENLTNQSAEES